MNIYFKVTLVTILCIVGRTRSSERESPNDVFKEMMNWLNSPPGNSNDDLQKQEHVSHVTKTETDPEQSRSHLKEELEGDYSEHNVKTQEYEGGGRSDSDKKSTVVSTFRKGIKGKHKKDSGVNQHSKKGKKHHKNNHKKHGSKSDDVATIGHKGQSLRSEGHSKKGKKEDGYKNIWHKEESGREKKFFDNAEEKNFSAKHDHMKAFHNAALKGAFKTNSEKDLHQHDNHGKKLSKKEDGSFEMFLKEKDSHGRRKDYGRKKKFGRKGAHEEVFKISKGNGRKGSNTRVGSHSNREPIQIKVIKNRNLISNSDNDIEESIQTSVSTSLPLASVLEEAGYGHRLLELPNKNITSQSDTLSNINEINDSFPEEKAVTHENRLKDKFLRLRQKHKNSLPKVPPKRRKRLRNINSKGKGTTSTVGPTESKRKNNKRNRNTRKSVKNLRRKMPLVSRRLKKLPNNINKSVTLNKTLEKNTKLIPIKEIQNNLEKTKDLKMIPKNTSPISIFVLKDPLQNKSPKITKGKYAGHKKHFTQILPKQLRDVDREENNEVEPESESPHGSAKQTIIVKKPFTSISEYNRPPEQPKITHHFNLVTIRPTSVRNPSPRQTETEQPKNTDQSRLVIIKPLEKERSQQIFVVLNESLKPSSSQGGHQQHNKPKKYAKFESYDEGHHKKKSKKIEKGGHEERGYKGKSLKDHGKSHKSKFIDKAKKKAKGHNFKKEHEGHYDKGKKGSKGHTHGKKSHTHKGHSDKGFKNVHHKKEYAVKKNFYEDDENKISHKIFDDFDAYFEKKRKENIDALNYHANKRYKAYQNEGHHHDNSFHDSKKGKKKHHDDHGHSSYFHHHDDDSHKDDKHGHHYHKDYSPHQGHNAVESNHYNYYDYYE